MPTEQALECRFDDKETLSVNSDDTFEARVARGAAWLDEVQPGWERRIDLSKLELRSACRCVLGQLYGTFSESAFFYRHGDYTYEWSESIPFGFILPLEKDTDGVEYWSDAEYPRLDEAWISLIKERFDTGTLSDEARS